MMDSRISSIENALVASEKALAGLTAERANIMPQLEKARYINADMIHAIEDKYIEKTDNMQAEIDGMKAYLKELKANA